MSEDNQAETKGESPEPPELDTQPRTESLIQGLIWTMKVELEGLIELLPETGKMLEVGTASGGTAALIARARPKSLILCLDNFCDDTIELRMGNPECRIADWKQNQEDNMMLFVGDLTSYFRLASFYPLYDLVFIDGDHHYEGVFSDLTVGSLVVRDGGHLAVHDYGDSDHPGVKEAVDKFVGLGKFTIKNVIHSLAILGVSDGAN